MNKFILTAAACLWLIAHTISQTVVKGNLKLLPATSFSLVCNQTELNEYRGEKLAEGKTGSDGTFNSSFTLCAEQPVFLFTGNKFYRLWLVPNTTLSISQNDDGKLFFTGETAAENSFFYHAGIMAPATVAATIAATAFEPRKQLHYLDSIEERRWRLFEKYIDLKRVSAQFVMYCKAEITHFSKLNKNQYALQNIYGANNIQPSDIPVGYYTFWSRFELMEDSCANDSYMMALRDYIGYHTSKQLGIFKEITDKEKYYTTEFRILDSLLASKPFTSERLKAGMLLFLIKYVDLPGFIQAEIDRYELSHPASGYLALLHRKWAQKAGSLLTKPFFHLKDTAGSLIGIQSLRGSVVYIDFWGSWCKPCLAQMQNSALLQQRFKGKAVVFVFIDFYDTKEKWLETIRGKKLTGIHLKAESENLSFFEQTFNIGQGFPRYALLDKEGRLITSSAPHPNDADVVTLIGKYL